MLCFTDTLSGLEHTMSLTCLVKSSQSLISVEIHLSYTSLTLRYAAKLADTQDMYEVFGGETIFFQLFGPGVRLL